MADLLPAGQLVVTDSGAHTLIDQLVELMWPSRLLRPLTAERSAHRVQAMLLASGHGVCWRP